MSDQNYYQQYAQPNQPPQQQPPQTQQPALTLTSAYDPAYQSPLPQHQNPFSTPISSTTTTTSVYPPENYHPTYPPENYHQTYPPDNYHQTFPSSGISHTAHPQPNPNVYHQTLPPSSTSSRPLPIQTAAIPSQQPSYYDYPPSPSNGPSDERRPLVALSGAGVVPSPGTEYNDPHAIPLEEYQASQPMSTYTRANDDEYRPQGQQNVGAASGQLPQDQARLAPETFQPSPPVPVTVVAPPSWNRADR
ncbi:hypothetical protein BC938DRAFT_484120 [Jimgerdemannia flammicorona]|uniref:Uncharacterized protein n=1 Tax=Jimgerdemannia flammicorona TaxID=994334 RepID=A0A433QAN0_9FUNG|nr:hypothetical protein BC938DRAFT_484120 [Jimgerdemannia flammicorona]